VLENLSSHEIDSVLWSLSTLEEASRRLSEAVQVEALLLTERALLLWWHCVGRRLE